MQQVHHRVTPVALRLVTGRQIDRHVAIRRLPRQISFERFAVNLDAGVGSLRVRAGLRQDQARECSECYRQSNAACHFLTSVKAS